jgi:hypothetical protein
MMMISSVVLSMFNPSLASVSERHRFPRYTGYTRNAIMHLGRLDPGVHTGRI